ncbi:ABC transporter ATP-binding protein [Bacteroides caecicola]|uniref:ABC transporter ATP-binding protein n=1 Tax=Bacteroides caecicola TaxID=1462569 RepID=UPI002010CC67|nr:ABC transporter ATP-binding protein [Bacteroides caecicola]MCL1624636.1 ABC transporter ATP-binding protein [Bacteroides caecicola]
MSEIAIQFDRVGKLYQLGLVGTGTLSHDLNRWWKTVVLHKEDPYLKIGETNDRSKKGKSEFVWALRDITFDVNQGDVVGIIGKNGAGKSTLLKLLSRVTSPTVGAIRAKGRIASLLEVGTGFHPELTGRENIYMNGSIMGMTRHEIKRKLDEIVDFAGVERYLDTPVKRYSSGMTVRLGFAVAAFLEPEILVVDEVLAVGDAEFQKKAIGKMQDVSKGQGRTVLFVSHNMAAVRSLCNKGVILKNGCIDYIGYNINDTINRYLRMSQSFHKQTNKIINNIEWHKSGFLVNEILFNNTDNSFSILESGKNTLNIIVIGESDENLLADLMVIIKNKDEVPMAALAEGHCKGILTAINKGKFTIKKQIILPKYLGSGDYIIDIHMHRPMVEWYMRAPHCTELHIDGYQEGFGRALRCNEEGFIGLESINI